MEETVKTEPALADDAAVVLLSSEAESGFATVVLINGVATPVPLARAAAIEAGYVLVDVGPNGSENTHALFRGTAPDKATPKARDRESQIAYLRALSRSHGKSPAPTIGPAPVGVVNEAAALAPAPVVVEAPVGEQAPVFEQAPTPSLQWGFSPSESVDFFADLDDLDDADDADDADAPIASVDPSLSAEAPWTSAFSAGGEPPLYPAEDSDPVLGGSDDTAMDYVDPSTVIAVDGVETHQQTAWTSAAAFASSSTFFIALDVDDASVEHVEHVERVEHVEHVEPVTPERAIAPVADHAWSASTNLVPDTANLPPVVDADAAVVIDCRALVASNRVMGQRVGVLQGVDLTVRVGEFVVITGRSGSGKSTLLASLAGLHPIDGGDVTIGGVSVARSSETELADLRASRMGFVRQDLDLIADLSAVENVELPLIMNGWSQADARAEAQAALTLVEVDRADRRPIALSGGERRRVAIARALVGEPTILLADEPTSGVDPETAARLCELLFELCHDGLTVIAVSHDPVLLRHASARYALANGRLDVS